MLISKALFVGVAAFSSCMELPPGDMTSPHLGAPQRS